MGYQAELLLFLLILALIPSKVQSWVWFFSSSSHSSPSEEDTSSGHTRYSEFSMEVFNNGKAVRSLENAKTKVVTAGSCWQEAYQHLFSGCKDIVAVEEKRKRFAWHLSDCFQKDSGRDGFPFCDAKSAMVKCIKKLDDHEHKIYLEFLLETNTICYQLQSHAFKKDIERLVNELKRSAQDTEHKLGKLDKKSDTLLQTSNQIQGSLSSVDNRIQIVVQRTNNLQMEMDGLTQHTNEVYQQAKNIAESQSELKEGQVEMSKTLKEGMNMLTDAYDNLGEGIDKLKNETHEIEGEISKLGDAMSSRMTDLQKKADDIGNIAGDSLDKQKELLDGQSMALEGLQFLTQFLSKALQESRSTLERLADYSHKQQEQLLERQQLLYQVHDHLLENSKSMLAAQETFEAKQANMFKALDKLFSLHNAMLLESRLIKTFVIYFMSIFIIYMFTSTKQTFNVRPWLYIGLSVTLLIETAALRFLPHIEQQSWIISLVRTLFVIFASVMLLHAVITYRDYEMLNHQILLRITEKINNMQYEKGLLCDDDSDSEVDWASWIDAELSDGEDNLKDPDFMIQEDVGQNFFSSAGTKRIYNLRPR